MPRCTWCLVALALIGGAFAAPAFQETFDDTWQSRWKKSTWKTDEGTDGDFTLTAGKWFGHSEEDRGIQTGPDARFYASYAKLEKPFDNEGKDLVIQFSVKHEQTLDCGGGYIKLIPDSVSQSSMESFSGETPYAIMFGPDICGYSTKKVHVIFNYKDQNHLIKKDITCKSDDLTHVYTLAVHPDNTYEVFIDTESVQKGSLYDDWEMLAPREIDVRFFTIPTWGSHTAVRSRKNAYNVSKFIIVTYEEFVQDESAVKPEDWDDRAMIEDPDDVKPEGYDDIPKTIPDPDAKKPDDWDDEDDGEWEAPTIANPEYKGEWTPKMIDNPDYKGIWTRPKVPNPDFVDDLSLYKQPSIGYVGFELWQVKSGSIFDNIILTDSVEEALQFAKDTWGKNHAAEEKMKEDVKAAETKAKEAEEEVDDDDDDVDAEDDKDEL